MPAFLKSDESDDCIELSEVNLVGRSPAASIHLDDASVSREHASIRFEDGEFWLHDLGSSNGSYINDLPVTNARRLRLGDRLQFGARTFNFGMEENSQAPDEAENGEAFKTQVLRKSAMGSSMTNAVLLVGDLRSYTELSSRMPADQLAILVRSWYEQTRAVLEHHDAFIDKFIGDAVFAYWKGDGTAIREKALSAARMLAVGNGLAAEGGTDTSHTKRMVLERHQVTFECHVGLHVGEVALGTMTRSNYTAVGDAVNKTFRIEAMTRALAARVLVSSDFLEGMDAYRDQFIARGSHRLKGYVDAVELHSLSEFDASSPPAEAGVVVAAP